MAEVIDRSQLADIRRVNFFGVTDSGTGPIASSPVVPPLGARGLYLVVDVDVLPSTGLVLALSASIAGSTVYQFLDWTAAATIDATGQFVYHFSTQAPVAADDVIERLQIPILGELIAVASAIPSGSDFAVSGIYHG